jgi:hypothetical protein
MSMITNSNITETERQALLMVSTFGVEVAIKQAKTQIRVYQFNAIEREYWIKVESTLHGIQNHALVA